MEGASLCAEEANTKEKELLIQYGSAASEAMFDFPCEFFRTPGCVGIIPYRVEHHCAVVIGEPICPPEELEKLTASFHDYCRKLNLNIIYVIVSEKFATWSKANYCAISIKVCDELILNPQVNPCHNSQKLRYKVEKAIKLGLVAHEYVPMNVEVEKTIQEMGVQWQQSLKGPSIFLGHLNFFDSHIGKRWFYVKDREEITSMLLLCRLEAYDGWLLKFLITKPHAVRGTSEFLVCSVLEILRNENCHYVTKSVVPTETLTIEGLNTVAQWMVKGIYQSISWIFKFHQRREYWLKFHPKEVPSYVLFERPHIGINELRALRAIFHTNNQLDKNGKLKSN